jgi:hypothetical protein
MTPQDKDIIIDNLKARWFDLAKKEDMPNTPDITRQLDNLTEAIRKMQAKEVEL